MKNICPSMERGRRFTATAMLNIVTFFFMEFDVLEISARKKEKEMLIAIAKRVDRSILKTITEVEKVNLLPGRRQGRFLEIGCQDGNQDGSQGERREEMRMGMWMVVHGI